MPTINAAMRADHLNDLVSLAADVDTSAPVRPVALTARDAARALSGLASWMGYVHGRETMHTAFSELAGHAPAWTGPTLLQDLPYTVVNGSKVADGLVVLLATVCSGLVMLHGPHQLRSGVAFWAVERDVSAWRDLIEGA